MAQIQNTSEQETGRPVTLPEVKALLEQEQASREELGYEQNLSLEHAQVFARIPVEKVDAVLAELRSLDKLNDAQRAKIVDVVPTHEDDVRAIFAKDRLNLEAADIEKILNAVRSVLE